MNKRTPPNLSSAFPAGGPSSWMEPLSPKRREIIRKVLHDPKGYVLLSVRAAAARLETDPATLVRIVAKMGFENYRSFQQYLRDLSIANATALDGMQAVPSTDGAESSLQSFLHATTEQDVRNLNTVRVGVDPVRLKALAKRIYQAKKTLIIGGDLAEALVYYLSYSLSIINLPVLKATSMGSTVHMARAMGKGDLVIAISFRKGLRQTVEGMLRAKKNGAYCVGITGTYVSAIAKYADEYFIAPVDSQSFMDSYVAPIALANQIVVAAANYKRADSMAFLREVAEEQRTGGRWFKE